jgi:cob(II)yrinic acid a,c-diamide reductase
MNVVQAREFRTLPVEVEAFREGMRNMLGGVTLVSTGRREQRRGMIVTSACSLTAEPPSLIVSVAKTAESHPVIATTRTFAINILSTSHLYLANRFSGKEGPKGSSRFELGSWTEGVTGSPVLSDALTSFDCKVSNEFDAGTHTIFTGLIMAIQTDGSRSPLGYVQGRYVGVEPVR